MSETQSTGPMVSEGIDLAKQDIDPAQFQSGESGLVAGPRLRVTGAVLDTWQNLRFTLSGGKRRLHRVASRMPKRKIVVATIYKNREAQLVGAAVHELLSSRHDVQVLLGSIGAPSISLDHLTVESELEGGKFENLNRVLAHTVPGKADCVIAIDDDVELPPRFLERFLFLIERFDLQLAQPALTQTSHCAWPIGRRHTGTVVRQTRFVEIGPLTAFRQRAIKELIPFPELKMGWGLDLHWAAVAKKRGWRIGVVDATPVKHRLRPAAADYDRHEAEAEARRFLKDRQYLSRDEASTTVAGHRRW